MRIRPPLGHFGPEQMPQHKGVGPTIPPDPDCCTAEHCPQRDYNRAEILATLLLSRAYAAMVLLEWTTRHLWSCADGVHTDCGTPECTFGSEQATRVAFDADMLAQAITGLYETLARPATDLTGQWQDLTDMELAQEGLSELVSKPGYDQQIADIYLDTLRLLVVDDDAREYHRWFSPPPSAPSRQPGH